MTCLYPDQAFVSKHGQLGVRDNQLVDQYGNGVQLRGMSLYWSQWSGKFYNYEVIKWLRDDWCCTVVRAAMAVDNGGYAENPTTEINKVITVVDAAIELGVYIIIDFHVHEAHKYESEAITFFAQMAKRYAGVPNIIYEPWNEPLNVSWAEVIKPYHEKVIGTIRKYDSNNIIVCGTPVWSREVDEAAETPILGTNIAYSLHYYAATHKESLRQKAQRAIDKGIALIVTEYGTTQASGDGPIDEVETRAWWSFLNHYKISHLNWSIADIGETSAVLHPGVGSRGEWAVDWIKPSGQLVRNELRAKYASEQPLYQKLAPK